MQLSVNPSDLSRKKAESKPAPKEMICNGIYKI